MKKHPWAACGLIFAIIFSATAIGREGSFAHSGDHAINSEDVLLALEAAPAEKRAAIVSDPKLMSQIIERVLFNRILASRVTSDSKVAPVGDENPLARDARLAEVYMTQSIGSPPDFSRFAAEQYAADPSQWHVPAGKQVQLLRLGSKDLEGQLAKRYSLEEFVELADRLGTAIQDLNVAVDREKDFEPSFWKAVNQLELPGDTAVVDEGSGVFLVRLKAVEQSRLRSREEAIPLIVDKLEADWKKAQTDQVMAELRQLDVVVDGAALIALRDRVLREAEAAQ